MMMLVSVPDKKFTRLFRNWHTDSFTGAFFLCYTTPIDTNIPMYKATIQLSYTSSSDNACDDILPEENIKMEVPAEDLNIHQYFHLFNRLLRSIGFCDYSIMQGGVQLAFNDMRDQKEMQKVANEYGAILLALVEECAYKKDELYLVNVRDILDIIEVLNNGC